MSYCKLSGFMLDYFSKKASKMYSLSHALCRVWEYTAMMETEFVYPLLDLGCGDGSFLSMVFNSPSKEGKTRGELYGLDVSAVACQNAENSGLYKEVVCAPSDKSSFPANKFKMIVSNCVIEHIPKVEETIGEANRILEPGGLLFFTTHSDFYSKQLFYYAFFEKIGLKFLAELYAKFVNHIFKHHNLFSKEKWESILVNHGFEVISIKYTHSPRYIKKYDLFMPFSAIQQCFIKTIGCVPLPRLNELLIRRIAKADAAYEKNLACGASFAILAKKI